MPTATVIVPTFGRSSFLLEAVNSVACQTYRNLELVIVDDCSPVKPEIPRLGEIDVKFVQHSRNMGPGAARNTGLAHATGEYVLFLDDDDLLTPDRLRLGIAQMGAARIHATQAQRGGRKFSGDMRRTLHHGDVPQIGQVLLHKNDVLQFDPTLRVSEDLEWWIRMSDRAIFSWSEEVGVRIRAHDEARPGVDSMVRARCRAAVVRKHLADLDPKAKSVHLNRAASAFLLANAGGMAIRYSAWSLLCRPSTLGLKLLASGTRTLLRGRARYPELEYCPAHPSAKPIERASPSKAK